MAGRPTGVVRKFLCDAGDDHMCSMAGCGKKRKKTPYQASKWAEHLCLKCLHAPEAVKREVAKHHQTAFIKLKYDSNGHPIGESTRQPQTGPTTAGGTPAVSQGGSAPGTDASDKNEDGVSKQQVIEEMMDRCDEVRAERITKRLTEFIVGCALPFTIVSTVFFIAFVRSLNAAYLPVLPKVDVFRRRLLPELFADTVQKVHAVWSNLGNPYLTLGFDCFKTEAGGHVVNVTETSGDKTAFKSCVEPGPTEREDAQFYVRLIVSELKAGAKATDRKVEEAYAGVVGDNVAHNQAAFKIVEAMYQLLFFFGCVAHCFDLLCEDVAKIVEFADLLQKAKSIAVFVKGHKYVLGMFKTLIGTKGRMLVLFPDTRFSYAYLMIERVLCNLIRLREMIHDPKWTEVKKGINAAALNNFEALVKDLIFEKKLGLMSQALSAIASTTHHIESRGARASWVFPLVVVCYNHVKDWSEREDVKFYFTDETREEITSKFAARWEGSGNLQVGLKNDAHILAYFLDPNTTPLDSNAPGNWEYNTAQALKKFYSGSKLEDAKAELNTLLLRHGQWGTIIASKQALLQIPEEQLDGMSNLERIIYQQKRMTCTLSFWQTTGKSQFPLLAPIAQKLAVVAIQSADVERVCKAHKVIHTKARNSLKNKTVNMLLFTYVNLRLLNQCTAELGDFLTQAIETVVETGKLAGAIVTEAELELEEMGQVEVIEVHVIPDEPNGAASGQSASRSVPDTVPFHETAESVGL